MTRRRCTRLLVAGLGCLLAAACTTSADHEEATATSQATAAPTQRDYWATAGWQVDAGDGQNSFSVTKSFVSALVGIALRDRHLNVLDQTAEESCWPTICPPTRPACGGWPGPQTPQGHHHGGGFLKLPARDLAVGFGDQLIQVIPDLDVVVVITSDAEQGRQNAADLVGAVIVSAVTGQPFPARCV